MRIDLYRLTIGYFRSLNWRLSWLSCINAYLAADSGGNVSDLVVARNCCMTRMLPGEAELVSEWTGLPGRAKSVQRFERSNGLDTALYKTTFTFFLRMCVLVNVYCFPWFWSCYSKYCTPIHCIICRPISFVFDEPILNNILAFDVSVLISRYQIFYVEIVTRLCDILSTPWGSELISKIYWYSV